MPSRHVYGWCWTCRCIVITKFLFFISTITPFVEPLCANGWCLTVDPAATLFVDCAFSVVNLQISFVWTCRSIFDYPFSTSFHLSTLFPPNVKISLSSTICFNAPFAQLFLWLSALHLRSLAYGILHIYRCGKEAKKNCLCILLESKRTEDEWEKWTRPYTPYS